MHGGGAQHTNSQNDLFFRDILKRSKLDSVKVLLVHFAGKPEKAESNKQIDSGQFNKNKGDKNITLRVATKENFIEQMAWADVIYFGGGTTVKLLDELKDSPDLKTYFTGKVIAGESAGANVLSTLCYSKSGGGLFKCLGVLPVFMCPHYEKGVEKEIDLTQISDSLEKVFLCNYQFKVFGV